jgi:hypothetical protein
MKEAKPPTKAEAEAYAAEREARIAEGARRAQAFAAATAGAADRSEKPGCYMRYGEGKGPKT